MFMKALYGACLGLVAFTLFFLGPTSLTLFAVCIGLIGFTLYGPDALMSGAAAMDVGSKRKAVLAAGIINGMGSVGAVVQELFLGQLLEGGSVGPVFAALVVSATLAAACLAGLLVRNRLGRASL